MNNEKRIFVEVNAENINHAFSGDHENVLFLNRTGQSIIDNEFGIVVPPLALYQSHYKNEGITRFSYCQLLGESKEKGTNE